MKKKTIRKSSEILKAAKRLIKVEYTSYICFAIKSVHDATIRDRDRLRNRIMRDIHPYTSYSEWLIREKPGFASKKRLGWYTFEREFKLGRLAWLDHLIAEYEAKGD